MGILYCAALPVFYRVIFSTKKILVCRTLYIQERCIGYILQCPTGYIQYYSQFEIAGRAELI